MIVYSTRVSGGVRFQLNSECSGLDRTPSSVVSASARKTFSRCDVEDEATWAFFRASVQSGGLGILVSLIPDAKVFEGDLIFMSHPK